MKNKFMKRAFLSNIKNWKLILILILLNILVLFLTNEFVITKEVYFNSYFEQLGTDVLEDFFGVLEIRQWISLAIIPFYVLIKSYLVYFCLSIGLFFYDDNDPQNIYKKLFKLVLIAEFIPLLSKCYKFLYFFVLKEEYLIQDFQFYTPLSYTNFLDLKRIDPWLIYPLQTINLFEIAYFFILTYGLHKLSQNKYSKDFEIVAVSYGAGLIIWLGLIMFLTLNIS